MSKSTLVVSFVLGVSVAYLAESLGELAGVATVRAVQAQAKQPVNVRTGAQPFKTPAEANTEFHLPPRNLPTPKIVTAMKPTPAKPKVSDCFKVDSLTNIVPGFHGKLYEAMAHSECPFEIPEVWVIVKFFDRDNYRIGGDAWSAKNVTVGEKLKHSFSAVINPGATLSRAEVMSITTDRDMALRWTHLNVYSDQSTAYPLQDITTPTPVHLGPVRVVK